MAVNPEGEEAGERREGPRMGGGRGLVSKLQEPTTAKPVGCWV